jgi:threonine synthase
MDPHTATCFKAHETCAKQGIKTIAYSTAEWTKFSPTIANALTGEVDTHDSDALTSISKESSLPIPEMIVSLFDKEVTQTTVIDKEQIEEEILSFISKA